MIIAVDIETQGLDCTRFILGCLIKETTPEKPEIYTNKQDLWNRIKQLGKQEQKRGKILNVYSHNATYDFYGYANLKSKNLTWFCHRPFIVAYKQPRLEDPTRNKEIIKFLDTWSIFKMPLKKLGEMVNIPKLETPQQLLEQQEKKVTPQLLKEIEKYCIRDTQIVLESIKQLKTKLKEQNINVKRLYTINQIAINYLINEWKKQGIPKKLKTGQIIKDNDYIFWNAKTGETRRTFRAKEIHAAYRGGRVECFQTGTIQNCTYKDCNSRYPHSAKEMKFPDLRTERMIWQPLTHNYKPEDLFNTIGLSRVMLKNETNKIGLIPIRTGAGNYYPKTGKYIIGTYTHIELKEAIKEGYTLHEIEWTIHFKEAPQNPLKPFVNKLYKLRKETKSEFDNYFYKMMMNAAFGKLAQTRTGQEMVIDSIELAEQYLKKNFRIIKGIDYDYMYQKTDKKQQEKKYYTPIIPTLINAHSRVEMYRQMKKIPLKDLVYTDTDSVMYTGQHEDKFNNGLEMGQYKTEHENKTILIYGRKTYKIGDEIKISGIKKKDITTEQFEQGYVQDKKMITIKTTQVTEEIGKFRTEKRDLNKQLATHQQTNKLMEEQEIYIDNDLTEINHFINKINEVLPSITK